MVLGWKSKPLCHAITVLHSCLLMSPDLLSSFPSTYGPSHDPWCKCMLFSNVPSHNARRLLPTVELLFPLLTWLPCRLFVLPTRAKVIAVTANFVGQLSWAMVSRSLAKHYFGYLCEDLGDEIKIFTVGLWEKLISPCKCIDFLLTVFKTPERHNLREG